MTTLDEYLDVASRQRWRWGRPYGDCVQFGLGWASARIGRPLSVPLAYSDPETARVFLDAHGGLAGVVSQWCEANGFAPASDPDDGDIGVAPVERSDPMNIAGACVVIRRGPWWLGKALRGFGSVAAQGIPAWRIF